MYSLNVKEWMDRVIIVSLEKSEMLLFSSETSSILTRTEWNFTRKELIFPLFFPLLQSGHSYRSFQSEFFYVYWNLSLFDKSYERNKTRCIFLCRMPTLKRNLLHWNVHKAFLSLSYNITYSIVCDHGDIRDVYDIRFPTNWDQKLPRRN